MNRNILLPRRYGKRKHCIARLINWVSVQKRLVCLFWFYWRGLNKPMREAWKCAGRTVL